MRFKVESADRYLITTADENTWPEGRPVLFLGVWCKRYNRRHVWSKLDSEIAQPYLDVDADKVLEILFDQLLFELTGALNEFHKVSHSKRYWNIIIGPWLRQYLKVVINRYGSLDMLLSQHDELNTLVYKSKSYPLVVKDLAEFSSIINNDTWNSLLYSELLSDFGQSNLTINVLNVEGEIKQPVQKRKTTRKRRLIFHLARFINIMHKASDAFILKSYLSVTNEIKLQISLFQIPQLWKTPILNYGDVNATDRIKFNLNHNNHSGLERAVRRLIPKTLPICYLDDYDSICSQVETFPWPERPKFIFTSNSFAYDEGFKFWCAKKVEGGVPYYVGQHGANYGTLKYSYNWTEVTTCDRFISWGWKNSYKGVDVVPAFNFKTAGFSNLRHNREGSLLLVERGIGLHDGPRDRQFMHSVYQQDMLDFFDYLPDYIKLHFAVRLHHGSHDLGSSDKYLWESHSSNVRIDLGLGPINKALAESRVVVITYDSSAILEMLRFDIPIVCFWRGGFDHLLPDAVPYYELLSAAGIVHDSPESAARHMATHWGKLDPWWRSNKVQHARGVFCDKYAKQNNSPVLTLKKILTDGL